MTVLEAVKRSKMPYFNVKGAIKAAQEMILTTEEVFFAQSTMAYTNPVRGELNTEVQLFSTERISGVIVVTNQRILFVHSLLGSRSFKEIRLNAIRSIDSKADLFSECLRIVGLLDMIVIWGNRKSIAAVRAAINDAVRKYNSPDTNSDSTDNTPAGTTLAVEQLQSLKQLYDSGVLTAEEFAAKKAQILNL